jgi:hypothetical protein
VTKSLNAVTNDWNIVVAESVSDLVTFTVVAATAEKSADVSAEISPPAGMTGEFRLNVTPDITSEIEFDDR